MSNYTLSSTTTIQITDFIEHSPSLTNENRDNGLVLRYMGGNQVNSLLKHLRQLLPLHDILAVSHQEMLLLKIHKIITERLRCVFNSNACYYYFFVNMCAHTHN